jgi:MFS family permease
MSTVRLYQIVLCFHLLGAFTLVSGIVVASIASEMARRRTAAAEIALVLGFARIGALMVMGGVLVTAGFGLWLVDVGNWGYSTPWVELAIGLLTAVVVIGALGGQQPKRARRLAVCLAEDGLPASSELRVLLDDRTALGLNYLSALLVLAIIVDMVVKPTLW